MSWEDRRLESWAVLGSNPGSVMLSGWPPLSVPQFPYDDSDSFRGLL